MFPPVQLTDLKQRFTGVFASSGPVIGPEGTGPYAEAAAYLYLRVDKSEFTSYAFVIFMLTKICDNRNCGAKNDDDK